MLLPAFELTENTEVTTGPGPQRTRRSQKLSATEHTESTTGSGPQRTRRSQKPSATENTEIAEDRKPQKTPGSRCSRWWSRFFRVSVSSVAPIVRDLEGEGSPGPRRVTMIRARGRAGDEALPTSSGMFDDRDDFLSVGSDHRLRVLCRICTG